MTTATKKAPGVVPAHRVEKTAYAVLGVLEKAGKEITLLAREGRKRVAAHERRTIAAARTPRKTRKA